MYSLETLSNNNLEVYFPFNYRSSDPDGKQTMDALYDYLTTKPVNYSYRMPEKGIFFLLETKRTLYEQSYLQYPHIQYPRRGYSSHFVSTVYYLQYGHENGTRRWFISE
jgi:hypothetical protein